VNRLDDRSASPYVDLSDEIMVSASQKSKSKKKGKYKAQVNAVMLTALRIDSNGNGKRVCHISIDLNCTAHHYVPAWFSLFAGYAQED
jgi:imidazoleglycerol phosphate dehydratase HisB